MTTWLNLRPTTAQYQAFAEYLCDAHSWYKHLPLLEGRNFVVFVNPAAGMGRRIFARDDREQDWLANYNESEGKWNGECPSALTSKYAELDREFTSLMDCFYQQELAKIERSLQNLDNWLMINS